MKSSWKKARPKDKGYKKRVANFVMGEIDSWPLPWRELTYEYGFQIVYTLRSEGASLFEAQRVLPDWRRREQMETLDET